MFLELKKSASNQSLYDIYLYAKEDDYIEIFIMKMCNNFAAVALKSMKNNYCLILLRVSLVFKLK